MANPQQCLLALLLAPLALALRQPCESETLQAIASPRHKEDFASLVQQHISKEEQINAVVPQYSKAKLIAGDGHLRCTRACGCGDNLGFFAGTAAARGLYVGCNSTKPAAWQPDLLVVGVTKGGTTSFQEAARHFFCGPWQEVHYFDNLQQKPTEKALRRDYLSRWEGSCQHGLTSFEKTPAYFYRGSAALRICEALPGQKLAALLRDPVARSYSHYWEAESTKGSPEDFHARVVTEMEVVRRCGGMALGRPEDDLLAGPRFTECCEEVAGRGWQGCSCFKPGGGCNAPYGLRQFSLVRFSIYVHYLRIWFRYHRPEQLLLLFSEDFFADMPGGMCEAHCHADALRAQQRCSGRPAQDFHERHVNSETRGPMLPATRKLLTAFFKPYNEELFALLGRRAPWG